MRRFEVWLDRCVPGVMTDTDIVELPDDATEEQIQEVCMDSLDTLIGNNLDTGWREIDESERPRAAGSRATNASPSRADPELAGKGPVRATGTPESVPSITDRPKSTWK